MFWSAGWVLNRCLVVGLVSIGVLVVGLVLIGVLVVGLVLIIGVLVVGSVLIGVLPRICRGSESQEKAVTLSSTSRVVGPLSHHFPPTGFLSCLQNPGAARTRRTPRQALTCGLSLPRRRGPTRHGVGAHSRCPREVRHQPRERSASSRCARARFTPHPPLSYHAVFFPRPDASRDRRGGDARDRDQVRARCARDRTWHGDVARGNNALNPPSEATLPPPRRSPSLPDIFLVLRCFPAISALRSSWAAGTRDPARARGY